MSGPLYPARHLGSIPCFPRWLRATWLGWFVGIPLIIGLALLGELVGLGGTQGLVGLGMGAGVGLMQARELRRHMRGSRRWFWATAIGLAIPFVGYDLAVLMNLEVNFSLYIATAVGGLIVGGWQGAILRHHGVSVAWWMVASVIGWTAAGAVGSLMDVTRGPRGIPGALLYLASVSVGGLLLGLCTATVLVRSLRVRGSALP